MKGSEISNLTETATLCLNHIGFVVASIKNSAVGFASSIGAGWDGQIINEPLQSVNVTFLRSGIVLQPAVELVEPVADESLVYRFLNKGGGLHHLCYEVESLETQLAVSRSLGGLIVKPPTPAVAFGGRRIAWVYTRHKLLLEFLEH
jgi:methylmalonyl-CoA/ethylmalonyl-CoA epimerase